MIPFTQYLRPDGRQTNGTIQRSPAITAMANELIEQGFRFECEILSDENTVSLTVCDVSQGCDVGIEIVPNGPEVPDAVDRLVTQAYTRHSKEK